MVAINPLGPRGTGAAAGTTVSTPVERGFAAQLAAAEAAKAEPATDGGSAAVAAGEHGGAPSPVPSTEGSGPPTPPSIPDDGATSLSGSTKSSESGAAALLSSLGLSSGITTIIKRARGFVPEGSSLQIFSTQRGRFQARFITDPSDKAGFQPPPPTGGASLSGGGANGLLPPAPPSPPTFGGSGPIGGPPAPPAIPPDEIVIETEESEEPSDGPPDPPGFTSPSPAPAQSSVASAYRSAAQGEVNPIVAAARIPDEAIDEQA